MPQFRGYQQQDAHEWLLTLIDTLDRSRALSDVVNLISGNFSSSVVCDSCQYDHNQTESFRCLELPVLPSVSAISLTELLSKFEQPEVLSVNRERLCPSCNQVGSATRRLTVSHTGDWLVIAIKRFMIVGNQYQKVKRAISYPMSDFCVNNNHFDLFGVVCHSGTRNQGHYTASIRSGLLWYTCNDSKK